MFDKLNFVILISLLLFNLRIKNNSKLNVNDLENFEFCIQIKIIKSSHKSINREYGPLDLIHSNICEIDITLTRNSKHYFIIFIGDCFDYIFCISNQE